MIIELPILSFSTISFNQASPSETSANYAIKSWQVRHLYGVKKYEPK